MKTTQKQFRLTTADIRRIERIQDYLKNILNEETITQTDAVRWALTKACPKVIIEEGE